MATRKTAAPTKKTEVKSSPKRYFSFTNLKLSDLLVPALVVLAVLLLGIFKNQFVVANVNGQQISRIALIKELEKRDGKAVLENMVTEQLIMQEAKKKKIDANDSEINSEISKIEGSIKKQGETLDSVLAQQNMSRQDLRKQIRIQTILKKMVGSVNVTDKEITDYMEQNQPPEEGADVEALKTQVKQQLEQQKLNEKIQALIQGLQKKAKVEFLLK